MAPVIAPAERSNSPPTISIDTATAMMPSGLEAKSTRLAVPPAVPKGTDTAQKKTHRPMTPIMAGIQRYSAERDGDERDLLVHTGVAPDQRFDVRVWLSDDEATSWTDETIVEPGFAQYSLATTLDDATLGLVYESASTDAENPGLTIRFARFDLAWVEGQ